MCRQTHGGIDTHVIPGDAVLRAELLEMFHDSSFGGHIGFYHVVH